MPLAPRALSTPPLHRCRRPVPAALGALLLLSLLAGCEKRTVAVSTGDHPLAVRVIQPRLGPMRETVSYIGTLRSRHEVRIFARLAGSLTALPLPEGAKVKERQVVARLATPDLRERAKRLLAEMSRVKLESEHLCGERDIDAKLVAKKAIPLTRLNTSDHRCRSSKKALDAARASLAEFSATKRKSLERAPFAGWVLKHLAQAGENVFPGKPVLLLGSEELELRVKVSERDIRRGVGLKSKAVVRRSYGVPRRVTLEVTRIAPLATGAGRSAEVGLAIPRKIPIKPIHGASLDVSFVLHEEQRASAIPLQAIESGDTAPGTKTTIYLVRSGKAQAMPVTLGIIDGGWISVKPRLEPTSRVVVSNLEMVRDGMALYPVLTKRARAK